MYMLSNMGVFGERFRQDFQDLCRKAREYSCIHSTLSASMNHPASRNENPSSLTSGSLLIDFAGYPNASCDRPSPSSPVFLLTNLTYPFCLGAFFPKECVLQHFTESFSGIITVQFLSPAFLHLDEKSTRTMCKKNASRTLIDLLPARPAASDKLLLNILLIQRTLLHPLLKLCRFSFCDPKVNHISCFPFKTLPTIQAHPRKVVRNIAPYMLRTMSSGH